MAGKTGSSRNPTLNALDASARRLVKSRTNFHFFHLWITFFSTTYLAFSVTPIATLTPIKGVSNGHTRPVKRTLPLSGVYLCKYGQMGVGKHPLPTETQNSPVFFNPPGEFPQIGPLARLVFGLRNSRCIAHGFSSRDVAPIPQRASQIFCRCECASSQNRRAKKNVRRSARTSSSKLIESRFRIHRTILDDLIEVINHRLIRPAMTRSNFHVQPSR